MLFLNLISNPILFVFYLISIVVVITIHEFAHAYAADKLGDPTPEMQGRLNLDPRSHVDPMGMLFLFMFGFGWGRPVQFDPFNLRNPHKDAALIAFAGPLSNIILAAISSIIAYALSAVEPNLVNAVVMGFLRLFITLNIFLAFFNLIPVHPMDGFKIVGGLLPDDKAHEWFQLERYGFIFLIMLIIPFGGQSMASMIVSTVVSPILDVLIPSMTVL